MTLLDIQKIRQTELVRENPLPSEKSLICPCQKKAVLIKRSHHLRGTSHLIGCSATTSRARGEQESYGWGHEDEGCHRKNIWP